MSFYLLNNQNPNAPQRGDGRRFWGYSSRNAKLRVIGLHTAENLPDFTPPDHGAENVARFLSRTDRPASYHEIVDSDSYITCLPETYTAFGIGNFNAMTYQLSFATQAHRWGAKPDWWEDAIIRLGAQRAAIIAKKYNIPRRLLTAAQARNGESGFVYHGTMDPSRRTDPGKAFPAGKFFQLVNEFITPTPVKPDWEVAIITDNDVDAGMAEVLGVKYMWKRLSHVSKDSVGHAILVGRAAQYADRYPKHTIIRGRDRRETALLVLDKINQDRRVP